MLILNGHIYSPGAPEVTLLNRSFKYGDGFYEDLRVWDGHILFLEDHLSRMVEGMKVFGYEFEVEAFKELMEEELKRAIEVNQLGMHGRLSVHVYRGGTGGLAPLDDRPMYLIEAYSLKDNYYEIPSSASVAIFDEVKLHYTSFSRFQTANSLPYVLAARFARKLEMDEALLRNEDGYLAQGSSHHLFVVKDRKVLTPTLKSGRKESIIGKHIQLICKELKIPYIEKDMRFSRLKTADEIFLANVNRGVVAINQLKAYPTDSEQYTIVPFLRNSLLRYIKGKYGVL